MHSFARSPTLPLISRFPGGRRRLSDRSCSESIDRYSLVFLLRPRRISNAPCLLSGFSVSSEAQQSAKNERVGRSRDGKALPWIDSYRGREKTQFGKRDGVRSSLSSWKESADKYVLRNGGMKLRDEGEERNGRRDLVREESVSVKVPEEEEEEEVSEPTDDSRWDRIKNKFKESSDGRPQFERPEVYRWQKQESWGRRTWQQAEGSSVPKMVGQGVYGVGPVLAALTVARRDFYALYVQEGLDLSGGNNKKKKDMKGVEKILSLANTKGLKVIETSKHDLNMIVDSRPHQGLVLDASPLELVDIKWLEPFVKENKKAPLWIALDEVTDPQNLGAITRSAYFFGVEGIVLCAKNSAPLSGVVSKASAGSLELVELRSCKNMMKFLTSSVENGWRVLGGSVSPRAIPLGKVKVGVPTILVLGNEGSGMRPLVERSCSQLVRIPGSITMNGSSGDTDLEVEEENHNCFGQELNSFLAVESLNVSVAAGVLLYHFVGEANCFQ